MKTTYYGGNASIRVPTGGNTIDLEPDALGRSSGAEFYDAVGPRETIEIHQGSLLLYDVPQFKGTIEMIGQNCYDTVQFEHIYASSYKLASNELTMFQGNAVIAQVHVVCDPSKFALVRMQAGDELIFGAAHFKTALPHHA